MPAKINCSDIFHSTLCSSQNFFCCD